MRGRAAPDALGERAPDLLTLQTLPSGARRLRETLALELEVEAGGRAAPAAAAAAILPGVNFTSRCLRRLSFK